MRSRRGVAAAAVLATLAAPAPAAAAGVSAGELRQLAALAGGDPAALARLRAVDSVDGRPVDNGAALEGASGADLRARLTALAAGPAGEPRDARAARAEAQRIVGQRRFHGTRVEGPFRGLIDRIGRIVRPLGDLIPRIDRALPGGRAIVWALLLALVGGLGWLIAGRTIRRRASLAAAAARDRGPRAESPAELERRAEEAERRGDHEEALRLRFRAGLLRLGARGAIELRPSLRNGDIAQALRSDAFDRLAADFDEVVYGDRPVSGDDVERARAGWPRVLEEARRR